MKYIAIAVWILEFSTVFSLPFKNIISKTELLKRKARSADGRIGCLHMESMEGEYTYVSDGAGATCGFYLIGLPDQMVELEFTHFNIDCKNKGLMAIMDGWELNGQFFPSVEDHPLTMQERYQLFCGSHSPKTIFVSSQNVALIQARVLTPGQGYKVKVRFTKSPQPCNVISMFEEGVQTLKNYGNRRNCTMSIIYPSKVQLLSVDVGVTATSHILEGEFGLTDKCELSKGDNDYVELLGTNGFESGPSNRMGMFCGLESVVDRDPVIIGCQNTIIRMVSSGYYYNTLTFVYQQPTQAEMNSHDQSKCMA